MLGDRACLGKLLGDLGHRLVVVGHILLDLGNRLIARSGQSLLEHVAALSGPLSTVLPLPRVLSIARLTVIALPTGRLAADQCLCHIGGPCLILGGQFLLDGGSQ